MLTVTEGRVDLVILCLLLALLGMGSSSYCGFSMEGKRHWIMESMPMEEKDMEGLLVQEKPFYHHSGCGRILYFPGISVFFWHIRKSWFSPMQPCLLFANSLLWC